jgi:hypothetical protein
MEANKINPNNTIAQYHDATSATDFGVFMGEEEEEEEAI